MSKYSNPYDTDRISSILLESDRLQIRRNARTQATITKCVPELNLSVELVDLSSLKEPEPKDYAAVDGTRDVIERHTHARLFAGGFAILGRTGKGKGIEEIDKRCAYSIVSLPYKIAIDTNDYMAENVLTVTNSLMLLSEIYVALTALKEKECGLILLDRPICGTLAHTQRFVGEKSPLAEMGAMELPTGEPDRILFQVDHIFYEICERLFLSTDGDPLIFSNRHLSSHDLAYLSRIGLELLFFYCREKRADLIGIMKTTSDSSFLRLLASLAVSEGREAKHLFALQGLTDDISMIETYAQTYDKVPLTREYDTALMTQFLDEKGRLRSSRGFAPPNRILRSYGSFGPIYKGGFAFAIERIPRKDEKPPTLNLGKNLPIYLYDKGESLVQKELFGDLMSLCNGPLYDALFYPTPLALAHRYAKSAYDYVRPRLKYSRPLAGRDLGYSNIKERFGG